MPPTKKVFTDLLELRSTDYNSPKAFIGSCQQLLPNRMKCHRAADYNVVEELPDPTEENPLQTRTVEYQVCRGHKVVMEREDEELLQKEGKAAEANSKVVQIGSIGEFAQLDKTAASLQPGDVVKIPVSILHQAMGITPKASEPQSTNPDTPQGQVQSV